jgi:hypothetical protein
MMDEEMIAEQCADTNAFHAWRDAEIDRLRAQRDLLALLLGECADELETEIHCRLSSDKATLRLELPHRAKAKLRSMGLLTPNA